ncbi:MAG: hypothetical protein M3N45_02535 [Actinomycetota bacterium]|nr:hypothetical protein [Actinomycetota bacterium]
MRLAKLADGSNVTVLPSELSVTVAANGVVDPDLTNVTVEVVSVALAISSEKVAVTLVARLTPVCPLEGLLLLTVGGAVSDEDEGVLKDWAAFTRPPVTVLPERPVFVSE